MNNRIAILTNHLAGNGRAIILAGRIEDLLRTKEVACTVFTDPWPDDYSGFTDIFLVGGDGTLHYYINHYLQVPLPVTLFNGGTGNDVHWMLYGSKTMEEQVELALASEARSYDIGLCNHQYFANQVGIGFEGVVAKALTGKAKKPGKTSFKWTVLKKLFTYKSATYIITTHTEKFITRKLLVDACNGKRAGGGFHVAPQAEPDDGFLDLVMADAMRPLKRLRLVPVIEKGKHLQLKEIKTARVTQLTIECATPLIYHLDGEYYEAEKLEVSIVEGGLKMKW